MTLEPALQAKLDRLEIGLQQLGSVLVAFSGGADSALLLAAAARSLGPSRVTAATAVSPSLPQTELADARDFAAFLNVAHHAPRTAELQRIGYVDNGRDRCFHCKAELLSVLGPLAEKLQLKHVATGTNADDLADRFRPGIQAARVAGAVTPLADAGLSKAEVRAISREWNLPTADKPAAACLSSRVAYGIQITRHTLERIERAEHGLRRVMLDAGLNVKNLRVRDLGGHAKVEVDSHLVEALTARSDLLAAVADYDTVEVDPRGFRSGSMNEVP
ncbi:ATP-dependent sacrificial sulfur transferase LarE [Streptomyces sp. NPDC051776]|uniref:ATP-dependent sacrificial sulfur transferase LarE n=1 Tax=Streptomyces sp. NPDC051776 TaxID=3155414 RepID=UPI003433848F